MIHKLLFEVFFATLAVHFSRFMEELILLHGEGSPRETARSWKHSILLECVGIPSQTLYSFIDVMIVPTSSSGPGEDGVVIDDVVVCLSSPKQPRIEIKITKQINDFTR